MSYVHQDNINNENIPCPEIFHSEFLWDRKSKFQSHLAAVNKKEEIEVVRNKLLENRKIEAATHNIIAYRIRVPNSDVMFQNCEDDGEFGAGGRVLHLLNILNAENVMVIVTRWYGGIHLGPDRFKHINNLAREMLLQHGYIKEKIGLYHVGGFYKFHYDSHPVSRQTLMNKPCCQHTEMPHSGNKCTICRYVTILMYLSDVEEGGETAFPMADQPDSVFNSKLSNMSYSCVNSPVLVAPEKGKAVMWYNNIIDPEHGWLGVHDKCAIHGGCPILKGDKWISNLWINAPQYHSVNKKTIFHEEL